MTDQLGDEGGCTDGETKRPEMQLTCPECSFAGSASPDDGCPQCGASFFKPLTDGGTKQDDGEVYRGTRHPHFKQSDTECSRWDCSKIDGSFHSRQPLVADGGVDQADGGIDRGTLYCGRCGFTSQSEWDFWWHRHSWDCRIRQLVTLVPWKNRGPWGYNDVK